MTLLQLVIAVLTIVTLLCTLIGLAVRYVLLPYLQTHVIEPVQQTNKQVSENHHTNEEPTVLDRISDVRSDVSEVKDEVAGVRGEVRAVARMHEGHLNWSENWVRQIEADLADLKQRTTRRKGIFR